MSLEYTNSVIAEYTYNLINVDYLNHKLPNQSIKLL